METACATTLHCVVLQSASLSALALSVDVTLYDTRVQPDRLYPACTLRHPHTLASSWSRGTLKPEALKWPPPP